MNELSRADYEYQREIRRRQMSDRQKIGLLVAMNLQQFETNQLLAQNLRVACQTNALLGQIGSTLDHVASLQTTHFEQVQRERQLKEVMFQFDKFIREAQGYGDPLAAAYGMKRLFDLVDRSGNGFSTADLSDLNDKREFDSLLARGHAILRSLTRAAFDELEEFEKLVGIYHERLVRGFDAETLYPDKAHMTLPVKHQKPPAESNSFDHASTLQSGAIHVGAGCGCVMAGFGILGVFAVLIGLMSGDPKALSQLGGVVIFGGSGAYILWKFYEWRKLQPEKLQREAHERKSRRNAQLEKWETEQEQAVAEIVAANQEIDAHNAEVAEKRRQAKKVFQATMNDMRSFINRFLGEHPSVQYFVARV